jgi:osmotically-inducible protein OsmY
MDGAAARIMREPRAGAAAARGVPVRGVRTVAPCPPGCGGSRDAASVPAMAGEPQETVGRVRQALRGEERLADAAERISVEAAAGSAVVLEAEVASVAEKRIALERAAAVPGVLGIVDRIRVRAAVPMPDEEVLRLVLDALVGEPAFQGIRVRGGVDWQPAPPDVADVRGEIDVGVADGVVTLNGSVPGLDDKRLAGVLAWWVPGSRDVVNGIAVEPPEEDGDQAIADAVRLALEKDHLLDAAQVRVDVRDAVVTLHGLLRDEHERHMAESDAWFVFAVDDVVNEIETEPAPRGD